MRFRVCMLMRFVSYFGRMLVCAPLLPTVVAWQLMQRDADLAKHLGRWPPVS